MISALTQFGSDIADTSSAATSPREIEPTFLGTIAIQHSQQVLQFEQLGVKCQVGSFQWSLVQNDLGRAETTEETTGNSSRTPPETSLLGAR